MSFFYNKEEELSNILCAVNSNLYLTDYKTTEYRGGNIPCWEYSLKFNKTSYRKTFYYEYYQKDHKKLTEFLNFIKNNRGEIELEHNEHNYYNQLSLVSYKLDEKGEVLFKTLPDIDIFLPTFYELEGVFIEDIKLLESNLLSIKTNKGEYQYKCYGDCWSNAYFADINNFKGFEGAYVEGVSDKFPTSKEIVMGVMDYNFYTLFTDKGSFDISMRTEHNGYYYGYIKKYKFIRNI